jgi:hypothetical protein
MTKSKAMEMRTSIERTALSSGLGLPDPTRPVTVWEEYPTGSNEFGAGPVDVFPDVESAKRASNRAAFRGRDLTVYWNLGNRVVLLVLRDGRETDQFGFEN